MVPLLIAAKLDSSEGSEPLSQGRREFFISIQFIETQPQKHVHEENRHTLQSPYDRPPIAFMFCLELTRIRETVSSRMFIVW